MTRKNRDTGAIEPHDLASFTKIIQVNLIGTFLMTVKCAAGMQTLAPVTPAEAQAMLRRLKFFHEFSHAEIWEVLRASEWCTYQPDDEIPAETVIATEPPVNSPIERGQQSCSAKSAAAMSRRRCRRWKGRRREPRRQP